MNNDPMLPDAPVIALLSLDANPFLADMSVEELTTVLATARAAATQPSATITLKTSSTTTIKAQRAPSKATKLKAFLDSL